MRVISDSLSLSTRGFNDTKDLTGDVSRKLVESKLKDGMVNLFVPGSTGGLTTIEYESGVVQDFSEFLERTVPSNIPYNHDNRWGDGNGFSHVRSALLGPSLTVPFSGGQLSLGTWQQIIFVDFDNRPRSRKVFLQFMGE
jgi:secondary thiamine-phosphate synthase enzyme